MNQIRKYAVLVIVGFLLGFVTGCATVSATGEDSKIVQAVLEKLLPSTFVGPVHLEHRNQYFDLTVDADNVRKGADGQWVWDSLTYERQSHFPIFSGLTWSSTGKVRLGAKPTAASSP